MADAGCSGRRSRRHFADVQDHILTGRFGACNSESRSSQAGHNLPVTKDGLDDRRSCPDRSYTLRMARGAFGPEPTRVYPTGARTYLD